MFARHHADAIELWRVDLASRKTQQLTQTKAVQLQPRYSPDGGRIAFVSTAGSGHFNLYVAELHAVRTRARRAPSSRPARARSRAITIRRTITRSIRRGRRMARAWCSCPIARVAYGTGRICSVALEAGRAPSCFIDEETSWRANPEVAPDGRRVLYSSYQGRQWHQLWVTTLKGEATLPLTFGEFDVTQARWSPDGRRVAYISNESGNVALWIREFTGGARRQLLATTRHYARPMAPAHDQADRRVGQASVRASQRSRQRCTRVCAR